VGQSIDLSANSTITGMQTTIRLMPESIMQTVNNTYGGVKTTVEQNASSWSAKVDQNGVINAINVSTEGAKINASKIEIIGKDGIDLKGYTTINGNFSIDNNGYMTAKNGGNIAGWTIGTDTLYSGTGASRVGLRSGQTGDNVVIYAGSTTLTSAPFRVTASGKVTCTNLTVTGGSISGASINIGNGAFTVSTAGAVSCSNLTVTGGSISGTSINIGNNNFVVTNAGNMTAKNAQVYGDLYCGNFHFLSAPGAEGGLIYLDNYSSGQAQYGMHMWVDQGDQDFVISSIGSANMVLESASGSTLDFQSGGNLITVGGDGSSNTLIIRFLPNQGLNNGVALLPSADNTGLIGSSTNPRWHSMATYYLYSTYSPSISSRTQKHDIKPLLSYGNVLDKLSPVSFVYNNDDEERMRFGLIYEDVIDVMPEICLVDEAGTKSLLYTELIPVFLKEIQELRKRVAILEQA